MKKITRPLIRYHGGKFRSANWIISHFPPHRIYTETFGGGGSVLLKKPRSYAEIYNDLDSEIVNLFRVARDYPVRLRRLLKLTPYARDEFELSYQPAECRIERARRTVVRSFQGFGSAAVNARPTGFRANSNRSGTTPAHDWANYPAGFEAIIDRLKGVVLENREAKEIMSIHDSEDCLHYVDPPYLHASRSKSSSCSYKFELSDEEHEELANFLKNLKGMVILSGYENPIYDKILPDWSNVRKKCFADGAKERTEILWLNPKCLEKQQNLI